MDDERVTHICGHKIPEIQTAEEFEREVAPLLQTRAEMAPAARFKLEDWNDVDFDPNEEWRVEDVLPMRGFGLIYGKPRSFKSFVAMDLAIRVVLGLPWAGKRVATGRVVYIAAEGAHGMRKRIAAGKMRHEVPRGDSPSYRLPRILGQATAIFPTSLPQSRAPASTRPS